MSRSPFAHPWALNLLWCAYGACFIGIGLGSSFVRGLREAGVLFAPLIAMCLLLAAASSHKRVLPGQGSVGSRIAYDTLLPYAVGSACWLVGWTVAWLLGTARYLSLGTTLVFGLLALACWSALALLSRSRVGMILAASALILMSASLLFGSTPHRAPGKPLLSDGELVLLGASAAAATLVVIAWELRRAFSIARSQ